MKEREAARVAQTLGVTVRYPQFSEFSTMTFDLPPPPLEEDGSVGNLQELFAKCTGVIVSAVR